MAALTKRDRLYCFPMDSCSVAPYLTCPIAFSAILTARTMALNSAGSNEKAESGPPSSLDNVRCFSIIEAPEATAAMGTSIPRVWSDSPAGTSNVDDRCSMVLRFISSGRAGYALVHFNRAIWLFPVFLMVLTAVSISLNVPIPVDTITGLPAEAIFLRSGISTSSGDATLYPGISICFKKSTDEKSKGVEKNQDPCHGLFSAVQRASPIVYVLFHTVHTGSGCSRWCL